MQHYLKRFNREYAPQVSAIIRMVSKQVPVNSPEADLMFAVFATAARDLVTSQYSAYEKVSALSAKKYLNSNMGHLTIIGIDPDWVRGLFKKANVEFLLRGK